MMYIDILHRFESILILSILVVTDDAFTGVYFVTSTCQFMNRGSGVLRKNINSLSVAPSKVVGNTQDERSFVLDFLIAWI